MKKNIINLATILILFLIPCFATAADSDDIVDVRKEAVATETEGQAQTVQVKSDMVTGSQLPSLSKPETGEDIKWQVLSAGGTEGASAGHKLRGTLFQTAVGESNSGVHRMIHGFWQRIVSGSGGCCIGIRGNANGDVSEDINISDITYLVEYLFGIPLGPAPACLDEGNANGDVEDNINISDITYLVEYLFGIPLGPAPPSCP